MDRKGNSNVVIVLLVLIIILILGSLCVLFATGKISFNSENEVTSENNSSNDAHNNYQVNKTNYTNFIGKWYNDKTNNEITIKNVTDNEITFTWFLYRLAGIDDDVTLNFENGKAIFFFQGYHDDNYDDEITNDERFIRKATLELGENGVSVTVKDVDSFEPYYKVVDSFDGCWFITEGVYTHPIKR